MALQPQELLGQLALTSLQDLDDSNGRVIVADPLRHTAKELKGPPMPFQEGLGTLTRKGLDEERSRIRQRHHKQSHLRLLAGQPNRGFAKVHLGFTRWMRQRQKDLLMRQPPGPNGVLDHGLAAPVAVFIPESLENASGRMPLLLGGLAILVQDLVDNRQEWLQLPLRPRLALPVTGWLGMRQDLLQRVP